MLVQGHRDHAVIADEAGQFDHAGFAEKSQRGFIGFVAGMPVA